MGSERLREEATVLRAGRVDVGRQAAGTRKDGKHARRPSPGPDPRQHPRPRPRRSTHTSSAGPAPPPVILLAVFRSRPSPATTLRLLPRPCPTRLSHVLPLRPLLLREMSSTSSTPPVALLMADHVLLNLARHREAHAKSDVIPPLFVGVQGPQGSVSSSRGLSRAGSAGAAAISLRRSSSLTRALCLLPRARPT